MTKRKKPKRKEIAEYIRQCIEARRAWANSDEGYAKLGPGSPSIPGLQEYYQVLAFVEGRDWPDR
jgi:hypothetical protein